jgi:hypothetical protein
LEVRGGDSTAKLNYHISIALSIYDESAATACTTTAADGSNAGHFVSNASDYRDSRDKQPVPPAEMGGSESEFRRIFQQ